MPLPPALLERLKRRGVIQEAANSNKIIKTDDLHARYGHGEPSKQASIVQQDDQEEIIAADYSDEATSDASSDSGRRDIDNQIQDDEAQEQSGNEEDRYNLGDQVLNGSVIGCPNKYNIYHECNKYCIENYGSPDNPGPSLEQRRHLALILRSFPLSPEWGVVYDTGVKTFYFWNKVTDHVSWFPPSMNSFSTPSADHIRRTMRQLDEQLHA